MQSGAHVSYDGSNVFIRLPLTFTGPGASPERIAFLVNNIETTLSQTTGMYNVFVNVELTTATGDLSSPAYLQSNVVYITDGGTFHNYNTDGRSFTESLDDYPFKLINLNFSNLNGDGLTAEGVYTFAHEIGHVLGILNNTDHDGLMAETAHGYNFSTLITDADVQEWINAAGHAGRIQNIHDLYSNYSWGFESFLSQDFGIIDTHFHHGIVTVSEDGQSVLLEDGHHGTNYATGHAALNDTIQIWAVTLGEIAQAQQGRVGGGGGGGDGPQVNRMGGSGDGDDLGASIGGHVNTDDIVALFAAQTPSSSISISAAALPQQAGSSIDTPHDINAADIDSILLLHSDPVAPPSPIPQGLVQADLSAHDQTVPHEAAIHFQQEPAFPIVEVAHATDWAI